MIGKVASRTLALPALLLMAVACSDSTDTQSARVSLALTDNPGDVDSVWVELGEIYLQGGGDQGHVTLVTAADAAALGLVNITDLAGETLDLAEDVEIDPGNYGQLRFVIEGAVLETEDGDVYTYQADHPHGTAATGSLQCPSCSQTGIKVLLPGEIANLDAGAHVIVLDFDVSQSFGHPAGASGTWVMHPVIRAVEIGFTGTLTGTVDVERDGEGIALVTIPACPAGTSRDLTDFVPVATAQSLVDDLGDPVSATGNVAEDGSFTISFLHPDDYDMSYVADVDFSGDTLRFAADVSPTSVDVGSGATVAVEYTITSATCIE